MSSCVIVRTCIIVGIVMGSFMDVVFADRVGQVMRILGGEGTLWEYGEGLGERGKQPWYKFKAPAAAPQL